VPESTYEKRSIALAQLETALRLFQEGSDLFSVITLAGAAEEILGKLVRRQGGETSVDSLARAAASVHEHLFGKWVDERTFIRRANSARNALKHLDEGRDLTVTADVRDEAVDMLHRAIDNYWLLEASLTASMEKFERSQRSG
jgi:hypothetical protein